MSEPLSWYNLPHLQYWNALYVPKHSNFAKRAALLPDETFIPVKFEEVPKRYRGYILAAALRNHLYSEPTFCAMTCRDGKPGVIAGWYKP